MTWVQNVHLGWLDVVEAFTMTSSLVIYFVKEDAVLDDVEVGVEDLVGKK